MGESFCGSPYRKVAQLIGQVVSALYKIQYSQVNFPKIRIGECKSGLPDLSEKFAQELSANQFNFSSLQDNRILHF